MGTGDEFSMFWYLNILSINVQNASNSCLHLNRWCACFVHLLMWNFGTYLGGCYLKQPSSNLLILFRVNSFNQEVAFGEGFAFDLIDFWWHTLACPHQLGHTPCILNHPNGPLIFSPQQIGYFWQVPHPPCSVLLSRLFDHIFIFASMPPFESYFMQLQRLS